MLPGPIPKSSEHHARDTAQNGSPTISFWSCTCGTIIDVSGISTIYQILLISSRPLESRAQCLENSRVGEGRGPRCRRLAMPSSSKTVMSAATDVDRGMVSPIKSLKLSGNSAEDMPGVLRHMYTLEVTKGWERSEKDRSTSPDSRTWKAFKEGDLDQQRKAEAQRKSAEQLAAEEQKKMAKGRGLVRQATTRLSAAAQQPVTAARRRMSASVQATLSASAADGSGAAKRVQPGTVLWWSYHSREFLEMPASQNKDLPCSPLLMLGYPIWMLLSQLWAKSEANAKAYADRQLLIETPPSPSCCETRRASKRSSSRTSSCTGCSFATPSPSPARSIRSASNGGLRAWYGRRPPPKAFGLSRRACMPRTRPSASSIPSHPTR